ncbi:MAG: type II toxin-antitoxin system RelE/ParE family toxin [bacterium]|nr:type II toxin-antitoxin system RelE/ParE family toxin [bacterium]
MNVEFVWPADAELQEAYEYYESQRPGLGSSFLDDFDMAVNYLVSFPTAWTRISQRTRKILLKRFPYSILYYVDGNNIYLIGIAHQHRNPDYYADRLL